MSTCHCRFLPSWIKLSGLINAAEAIVDLVFLLWQVGVRTIDHTAAVKMHLWTTHFLNKKKKSAKVKIKSILYQIWRKRWCHYRQKSTQLMNYCLNDGKYFVSFYSAHTDLQKWRQEKYRLRMNLAKLVLVSVKDLLEKWISMLVVVINPM